MKKYLWILLIIPSLCFSATGDLQTIGGKVDTAITSIAGKAGTAIATINGKNYTDGDGGGYATPAVVQSNSGYSGGPATLGSNSTTGNTLAVWISGSSSPSGTTLSGGGVTTWNRATVYDDASGTCGCWFYGYVTSGGAVSVSLTSAPSDPGWSIYEISGVASTDAFDDEAGIGSATLFDGAWTSGTATASLNGAALLGGWASENTLPGVSWGAGWGSTTLQNTHYHGTAFRAVTTSGDYEASGTNTTNGNGIAVILVLKAKAL